MGDSTHGTMLVSFDLELSWGRFDNCPLEVVNAEALQERPFIRKFLSLLDYYKIPATWAMVGHLMLDGCRRDADGNTHNDITPHARYTWFPGDWYRYDPCMSASSAPAWYAPDVLEWIRKSNVPHEIGSHSFSHILYDHPESSRDMVEADLKAAVEAAAQKGITLRSFVFPRNQIGHLEILRMFGISSFRGVADPLPRG